MCGHIYGHVHWKVWEDLAGLVKTSRTYTEPVRGTPDLGALRRSLTNAWGTEFLLALNYRFAREDDLVRLTNAWAVVQAYYVHYHATHALLAARGRQRPPTHEKTQAVFADTWAGRRVFIPPCSFGVGPQGLSNAPPGIEIDPRLHSWSACDEITCWSLAAVALRTTRNEDVEKRKGAWRERKRRERRQAWQHEEQERLTQGARPRREPPDSLPRLTPDEHQVIERSVRTHTVMDYLYRLRVKANYLDASMFTEGPRDKDESRGLLQDLKDLAANVLLVHEMHVLAELGKERFLEVARGWASEREGPRLGLLERLDLLASC